MKDSLDAVTKNEMQVGLDHGKSLVMWLSETIRNLSKSELSNLINAMNDRDVDATANIFGGTKQVLSKHSWLSSLPGFACDSKMAADSLNGYMLFADILISKIQA